MYALIYISFMVFALYTLTASIDWYLTMQGAMPSSLSSTYYLLESHRRGMGSIFTIAMVLCAVTIIVPWIEATPDAFRPLPFFGTAGIGFVGAAPFFREGSMAHTVHVGGAVLAAVCSLLWGVFVMGAWFTWVAVSIAVLLLAIGTDSLKESRTFHAECICFFGTYITLISLYV